MACFGSLLGLGSTILLGKSWVNKKLLMILMAFLGGAVLPLSFAPHHYWPLAILSPIVLLSIWQINTLNSYFIFLTGLAFGLGFFGVGVSWVFVSIHRYGNTEIPMAVLITFLLVFVLSLFIAFQGVCIKKIFKGSPSAFWLMGFPSGWVLFEWIRGWAFTGFPWLYLGNSQLLTPLSGYAPIASVYGISFAVVLTSGALFAIYKGSRNIKYISVLIIIFIWGFGSYFKDIAFTQPSLESHNVCLVQGNIAPFDKFSQEKPILATEKSYGKLTKDHWNTELILWPESAIPLSLPYAQKYLDILHKRAKKHHATLITGVQIINAKNEYHNSLIALGEGKGIYHKQHLVPFGDFVPFEYWLRGLINFFDIPMSSFVPGSGDQALINTGKLKLNPLICYEIAFPMLVRKTLRDAQAIVTLSEDGWFGNSWGPHQHLEIARMRALETGRYVLRVTTSGITAIIDPKGEIIASIPQFIPSVLTGSFYAMSGNTPWIIFGLWPLMSILISFLISPGRIKLFRKCGTYELPI